MSRLIDDADRLAMLTRARHLAYRWRDFEMSPFNSEVAYDPSTGFAECTPERPKICIYGAGRGREEAPLEDPTWTVWALNLVPPMDQHGRLRADVWWDIHQRVAQTEDDLKWMAECPFPIYVTPDCEDISPRAIAYPLAQVEAIFRATYWACTFSYQIALAICMGADEIGLYGVELPWGTMRERTVEWANVAYWIGQAEARGVTVRRPAGTMLANHFGRYGFEYTKELDKTRMYVEMMEEVDDHRQKIQDQTSVGG